MKIDEWRALLQKRRQRPTLHEHGIQCACVNWFRMQYPTYLIFAVPNAARRSQAVARIMKEEGMMAGVADLVIVIHNNVCFVEMKTAKGRQQETQKEFQGNVERLGFQYFVCRSLQDFQLTVERWLKDKYIRV